MRINIYQIDGEKDTGRVKFEGYNETLKNGGIDPANYPFDDDCMILGNEEAKLIGMEGNRRLGNAIYAGPIFITRDNGEGELCSFTDKQVQKYSEMFAEPHDISSEETQVDVGFTFYGW